MMHSALKASRDTYKVFAGGVPFDSTPEELRILFRMGEILPQVDIPIGKTGRRKGYAIITYNLESQANKLLSKGEITHKSKVISLRLWKDTSSLPVTKLESLQYKIYVEGIKKGMKENELKDMFEKDGRVDYFSMV